MDAKDSRGKRFLSWVNADDGIPPEEELEDDDEHHDEDHDEAEGIPPEAMEAASPDEPSADYEEDDEFEYPDKIAPVEDEGEIDYADTHVTHREAVHMTVKQRRQLQRFRVFYLILSAIVALNVIGIMLLTVNYLPEFGSAENPAVNEVYIRYVEQGMEETAALNIVAAVLFSYRSFDTLGEALMLFTAAIGVIILMKEEKSEKV